jgi:hypothetical protein
MARSSLIRRRQEAERARIEAYEAILRSAPLRARPAPDFQKAIDEAQRGFRSDILRDPAAWQPRLKTRDEARLRMAAVRYLFARYPVAEHLEQVWVDSRGLEPAEILLRKRWYIVAASGGSLYKEGAGEWLSRKEVHAFLNPLPNLGFEGAFWQAIARSYSDDPAIALRIARSRFIQTPRGQLGFWREVVRFFCAHPTSVEEMDDLHDYLAYRRRRSRKFNLKGRTLPALRRLMGEWHHDVDAIERIEAARRAAAARLHAPGQRLAPEPARWPGAAIADWFWSTGVKAPPRREEFQLIQLCTAADLVAETRAMRHCVASYASKCIAGRASIWSLRHRGPGGAERLLTIELDARHKVVQIRGFANRLPLAQELKVLERWAKAREIGLP